jgi:hypothetical protein
MIPPAELYEHIDVSFQEKNPDDLLIALTDLANYIFQNGFDDPDELDRSNVMSQLFAVCDIPIAENLKLAPTAFHILSLLQAKGPAYPYAVMSTSFVDFCLQFIDLKSPIMYYPLTCLVNYCVQGEAQTTAIMTQIPVPRLRSLFDQHFVDTFVREAVLDLGCRYAKYPLSPEDAMGLISLCHAALLLDSYYYFHSAYWILVRLLRRYEEAIPHIMQPDLLSVCHFVLRCRKGYDLIPGLIFISYVYELGFCLPGLSLSKLLKRFSGSTEPTVQRQACRTLIKLVTRRRELIPAILNAGIFGEISFALERARFRDKHEIGLLACFVIEFGGDIACMRVFRTNCVNLWIELFEFEDDELSFSALAALDRIFRAAEEIDEKKAERVHRRFVACGGVEAVRALVEGENELVADAARAFFESYLTEIDAVEEEEEDQMEEVGCGSTW